MSFWHLFGSVDKRAVRWPQRTITLLTAGKSQPYGLGFPLVLLDVPAVVHDLAEVSARIARIIVGVDVQRRYRVLVRGAVPKDLSDRISALHASALLAQQARGLS